jgi:WD40 repeat protein
MLLSASLDGTIKIWDLKDSIKSVEANHCLNKEQNPLGEFLVLQEHSCILSVGNGNNFIKIIYV